MRTLEDQMSFYAAYHQDARNRATHYVGVPAIVLSLFVLLAWVRWNIGPAEITGAMLLGGAALVYYFMLDVPLALALAVLTGALVYAGDLIAREPKAVSVAWFVALFVGGWILQLIGHAFEGRKPALTQNVFQIFVAPIFLCAEAFFALGYKPALHAAVQRRALEQRAAAGIQEAHPA